MSIYFICNFQWIRREIKKQCEFRFCRRISNSHSMRKRKLRTTSALRFTSYIIMSKYSNLYSVLDYLRLIFRFSESLTRVGIHSDSLEGISRVYSVANSFRTGPVPNYFLIRRSRNRTGSGTDWRNAEKIPYNLEDNPPRFWDQNQLEPAPCFYSISYPNQWFAHGLLHIHLSNLSNQETQTCMLAKNEGRPFFTFVYGSCVRYKSCDCQTS